MITKILSTVEESVHDIFDGATIMISGFGEAGSPIELIHALIDQEQKPDKLSATIPEVAK